MAVIARDKLLDDLRRSGLLDDERLNRFLEHQETDAEAEPLIQKMVEAGLLTQWQADGLLAGKWRGFFLGKYKLLQPLGNGAMGTVYLAEHKVMRHRVAIKVLARHLMSTPNIVDRFEREARAAAVIHHPNVVRAFDVDCEGDIHFLVMEYVQGEDLRKVVEKNGPLEPRLAAEYTRQVARGLHEAHRNGMVHRDIKPANLLLDKSGLVKILDLGLARLDDENANSVTVMADVQVLGTVDYLAPEQAVNSHNIDGRADLYSLGCTLYFLLTGVPPFPKGSAAERMLKHQMRRPLDIRKRRPGVPDALVSICTRLMENQPDKRFATAGEAADAIEDFLAGRYQSTTIDDLTFAEDADTSGSSISGKTSQSSSLSPARGGSSTAAGASLSQTVSDRVDLPGDAGASKSLLKPVPALEPEMPVLKPATSDSEYGLTPLTAIPGLSDFDKLPPGPTAAAAPPVAPDGVTPLDALPSLGDAFSSAPILGANPLAQGMPDSSPLGGPAIANTPVAKKSEPGEKSYPLWALLGIGLGLGLLLVGIAALLHYFLQ